MVRDEPEVPLQKGVLAALIPWEQGLPVGWRSPAALDCGWECLAL